MQAERLGGEGDILQKVPAKAMPSKVVEAGTTPTNPNAAEIPVCGSIPREPHTGNFNL